MRDADLRDALERTADELFVGRDRERTQLETALKDAIGGRGRIFLVAGEPGIGKTRLAERVAASAAERGVTVLWGRCWEGEGAPAFWPWVQIARAYLRGRDASSLAARLGLGGPYVAQIVPEVRELLPDLPQAPALDSEQARFRLYDSFSSFLKNAASVQPLVLVLDDLHWADKSSLLLLQFLARDIADARLLLVATYRDVEVSRGTPLAEVLPALRRERSVERILVRGLGEEDVRTMLVALGGEQVPDAFADEVARETGGNPFFIKELGRHLLDEGIARREGDRWVGVAAGEIRLPESVRDVIGRRLARLGEPCTKLLTIASVVGQEFGLDLLGRAAELEGAALGEAVQEAVTARVIEEVPQAIGRYRFSHALVRETLYQELPTLERVRLHGQVAAILESLSTHDPDARLAELAHHFFESLPGGDAAKAADCAVRAGDRASERLAYQEAAILYDRALKAHELAGTGDARVRCELLLKLGHAQWNAGGFKDPSAIFQQARELAENLGANDLLARAVLGVSGPGVGYSMSVDRDEADLLERALATLDPTDSADRARMMARLSGHVGFGRGKHKEEDAVGFARRAIEMARRVGDRRALGYVLNATPWAIWTPDNMEERLALADEALRLADEVGDRRIAAEPHLWKASYYLEIGDREAADRELEATVRHATTTRHPYHRYLAGLVCSAREFLEGNLDEAARYGTEAFAAATEAWGPGRTDWMLSSTVLLQDQQALISDEEVGRWEGFLANYGHVSIRARLARLYLQQNRLDDARKQFDVLAAKDFADVPRNLIWLWTVASLAHVAHALGDARRAEILYGILRPFADRCAVVGATVCMGSVSRQLGLLAATLRRFDDAERHFVAGLEMNARIRARIWLAHTQHDYARMLWSRGAEGDRERAAKLLEAAGAAVHESGMQALKQSLAATLAETGLRVAEQRPKVVSAVDPRASFRLDGDFWSIAYEGKSLRLKDSKGLQYIAALLAQENAEIHAADLAAGTTAGEGPRDRGDAGEILDPQARSEYRQRLEDLESELEEAKHWSDVGRAARITEEIDFLKDELSAAFGVGGRARKAGDTTERARKAVASRIRDSIERIGKEHRTLALHFENAIRTGAFCSYRPDRAPGWKL